MTHVIIYHDNTSTTIKNPDFIDTLCNTNEVAVDGKTYSNVSQVQFDAERP